MSRKIEMSDEAKAARNEYQKQWRDKNKDKIRKYLMNHWENVATRRHAVNS